MEHKAGLRARFVRNSIGGGSHDPRNWIGCVSRREETTVASRFAGRRKEARKETILSESPIRIANPYWSTDNWIVPLADDQSPAKVDESANISFLWARYYFVRCSVSPCYSLVRRNKPWRPPDRDTAFDRNYLTDQQVLYFKVLLDSNAVKIKHHHFSLINNGTQSKCLFPILSFGYIKI